MSDLRVIGPGDRASDVASGAMLREAAISSQNVGADRLWMGFVQLGPGLISGAHHHGEAESGIYLISGTARFYTGDGLQDVHEAGAGDFIWVPPHVVHIEQNASPTEPAVMVVARSTQETLVFNVDAPEVWEPKA